MAEQEEIDQNDGHDSQSIQGATDQLAQLNVAPSEEEEEEEEEDSLANLPKNVLLRIDALRQLQEAQAEVEEEFEKERKMLDLKYERLYQPFYTQRAEIVSGTKEVEAVTATAPEPEQTDVEDEENVKGIPGFWLRAFMNHSALADLIQERDLPAFEFLKDVHSVSHEKTNGFKLTFEFAENPFFSNTTLVKEYDIGDVLEQGEAVLRNVKGTIIEWKEGQNLCMVAKKVKQRVKGGKGESRVVSRIEPCESFFHFFTPVEMPSEEDDEDSEMIIRQMSGDFEIGFTIHDTIIPQALLWFTGEAVEDDSDYEEEEEEEDYEESLSDDDAPKLRRGKKKFPALDSAANSTEKPPECNNQ